MTQLQSERLALIGVSLNSHDTFAQPLLSSAVSQAPACSCIVLTVTFFLYRDRVRIVAGRFDAIHQRLFEPHATSTLPEHRAQHVAHVSGKRAKPYLQREHLLALGRSALEYLTELTHRRPGIWLRDVDRLHALLATYGDNAIRAAFARGLAEQAIGAEYIAHYLAATVTIPAALEGDRPGQPPPRSSLLL